jgi:hypothetical protein
MKITKNNLKKFNTASCSQEETSRINNWLLSNKDEHTNLPLEELSDIKLDMWNSITDSTSAAKKHKVIPLYKKVMRYTAVACVVVSVVFMGADKINLLDTNLTLVNNTSEIRTKTIVNGLELGLTKKSTANLNSTLYNCTNQINFCGNMTIKNTTGSNLKIKVQSTCDTNEIKETVLLKNRTYYAFTLKEKNKEKLYVINKGQLKRMPPHLMSKINAKINVITKA